MLHTPPHFLRHGLLLVLTAVTLAWGFGQTSFHRYLNGWSEDSLHRLFGPVLDMSDVVVVDIDEESIEQLRFDHGAWPYTRDLYAQIVRNLKALGVRTFAFDILLAESRDGDDDLGEVLSSDMVVAAAAFPRPPLRTERYLQQLAHASLGRATDGPNTSAANGQLSRVPARVWPDITLPLEEFVSPGRARVGIISVRPDDDGTLRRVPLFHEAHGHLFAGFSLAAWATREDLAKIEVREGKVRIRNRWFSLSPDGEVRLRFPRELQHLKVLPLHRLIGRPPAQPAELSDSREWLGKTVFIGSSSILFGDYAHTPLGRMSGLVLSAIVTQSLAAGYVFHPLSWPWSALLLLLATVPSLLWLARQHLSGVYGLVWALPTTVLAVGAVDALLFRAGYTAPWLLAMASGLFALGIATAFEMFRLRTERERLAFDRTAAQEASRMKGEFLAHMAHELRTPLTAITGFNKINQLNDQIGPEQRRRNSAIIAANCEHLLKLVNDNLDLAKIDTGQMRLLPAAHSLDDLVQEVASTFGPQLADRDLALVVRLERPMPAFLWIDGLRVRQVLLNILGNAVKFTERGRIDVQARWQDDILDIYVTDTGPGVDPAIVAHLFEPFRQGTSGALRAGQGAGLGLTIARRLARLMGGELSLEGSSSQGSRFRFWIPAVSAAQPGNAESGLVAPAIGALSGYVLLVEDDEDIRALMSHELTGMGLRCRDAVDGLQAVHACDQERFDVILMDLDMPTLSGSEAVQVIRARGVRTPIIALTAHGIGVETEIALSHGFDAVLVKPVTSEALSQCLAQQLAASAAQPPALAGADRSS